MSVRVIGLTEQLNIQDGDYIPLDNVLNGTHKFDATKLFGSVADVYDEDYEYTVGSYCIYQGMLYQCLTPTTGTWDVSAWEAVNISEILVTFQNDIDDINTDLDTKVDKVTGKGLSSNDFTDADVTKLNGIESGAEVNVQANWSETDATDDSYIQNKPVDATQSVGGFMSASDKTKLDGIESGAEVNVQANWNETDTSDDSYIQNKPTNATQSTDGFMSSTDKTKLDGIASGAEVNVQANWNETNSTDDSYIQNKPTDATQSTGGFMSASDKIKLDGIASGAEVNVQADWDETDQTSDSYIQNKPVIPAGAVIDPNLNPTSQNPVTNATTTNTFYSTWAMLTSLREASSTAASAHAVGTLFVMGTTLYITTSAISIGDTITVGTNCVATNIELQLDTIELQLDTKADLSIIADSEISSTSANAYAIGDYFILDGILYIATAAIAIGDTITVGTNCSVAQICSELTSVAANASPLYIDSDGYIAVDYDKIPVES